MNETLRRIAAPGIFAHERMALRTATLTLLLVGCGGVPSGDAGIERTPDAGRDAGNQATTDAGACTTTDLEGKLRCIPGLSFVKAADAGFPGYSRYELTFQQPVDHLRADAGTFPQRLFLLATAPTAPMVFSTSGYTLSRRRDDLTRVYTANQLTYELRYFAASRPTGPIDWSTNTIRQQANDAHRLVEAFKPLFPAKWVSTGISRGGMASVYHRRFFPDDVDATVPVAAPYNTSRADPAYPAFLNTVGGATWATCRQALLDFQRESLMRRAELEPLMFGSWRRLTKPIALEHAVIEVGFAFWQYTKPTDPSFGCSQIPPAGAPAQDLYEFINVHAGWDFFTDSSIASFDAFYVTSALELGGPAPHDAPLAPLVTQPGSYTYDDPRYLPPGFSGALDPAIQADVTQWVSTSAERMLVLRGEFDPWSARDYAPNPSRDNVVFTVPGGNHGVRLGDLPAQDQSLAWSTLDRWLEAVAVPSARAHLPEPVEFAEPRGPM